MRWEEKYFLSKEGSIIWMKFGKRELSFIKHNITGDVHTTGGHIKTLDTFMLCTITKKDALLRSKHKFPRVVGKKVWPTGTPKNTKCGVIWCDMKETFSGSFIGNSATRPHVDEMHGSEKVFVPKF